MVDARRLQHCDMFSIFLFWLGECVLPILPAGACTDHSRRVWSIAGY